MRKLLAILFTAALIAVGSVSVSWGNKAQPNKAQPESLGGTWETLQEVLGGTWE